MKLTTVQKLALEYLESYGTYDFEAEPAVITRGMGSDLISHGLAKGLDESRWSRGHYRWLRLTGEGLRVLKEQEK